MRNLLSIDISKNKSKIIWSDWLIFLIFAIYAFVFFLGRWGGERPYVSLGSDLAINVAGSAAALDHPDAFQGDPVLGDPGKFQYYMSAQIPLTRLLVKSGLDYGTAVLLPLGLLIFLHLLGFYFFGRVIFKSRFWGFLLAIFTIFTVVLSNGEFWGVYGDPYPRFAFQAFLPYILGAAILGREKTGVLFAVMAALGLMIYIHAISALTWAVPVWLCFWLVIPRTWSRKRALCMMSAAGLVFLVVSLSFWINYLSSTSGEVASYQETVQFIKSVYPYYFNPLSDFGYFLEILRWDGLLIPALVGVLITCCYPSERRNLRFIGVWIAGLLFATLLVPSIEVAIRMAARQIPVLPILVRGERYLVFFFEVFWIYPLVMIERNLSKGHSQGWRPAILQKAASGLDRTALRVGVLLFGILAICLGGVYTDSGYQSGRTQQWKYPLMAMQCWGRGRLVCPASEETTQTIEMLTAVKDEIPAGKTILPLFFSSENSSSFDLAVRYYGLHPVVYTAKDFSTYWQSAPGELLGWKKTNTDVANVEMIKNPEERLMAGITLAGQLGADYLIVDWKDLAQMNKPFSPDFHNRKYSIINVSKSAE